MKLLGRFAFVLLFVAPLTSSTIQTFPAESSWIPSYPPRPRAPETSVTVDGYVAVAAYVGLDESSVVNRSLFAHGSQVDPSIPWIGLPSESVVASSVTRCATSASRLIRVM